MQLVFYVRYDYMNGSAASSFVCFPRILLCRGWGVDSKTSYLVSRGRCTHSEPKKDHEYLSHEVRDP